MENFTARSLYLMMNYSSFFDRVKKIDEKQKGIRKKGSFSIFQFYFFEWLDGYNNGDGQFKP